MTEQETMAEIRPHSFARTSVDTAREQRRARGLYRVTELLSERPELRGVHRPADVVADTVSWCA